MKPENYENRLADYLGNEMSPDERHAFEQTLRAFPECQAEVDALQAALADLRQLPAPIATTRPVAPRSTAAPSSTRPGQRLSATLLKTAAVLVFGVIIGRLTAPNDTAQLPPSAVRQPPAREQSRPDDRGQRVADPTIQVAAIHPAWIELGRKLGAGAAGFGALPDHVPTEGDADEYPPGR